MARFSDVAKGKFARRRLEIEINDSKITLDVRVLTPQEEADVIGAAAAFARERGLERPEDGDSLFDLGKWIHTAAVACVDPDSPEDKPVPFFDGGVAQIEASKVLTRQHLAYIYEHVELWQDQCSPYQKKLTNEDLIVFATKIAEGDSYPFVGLPPATRWLLVRGLALRLVNSLGPKSPSGGSSPENTPERSGPLTAPRSP